MTTVTECWAHGLTHRICGHPLDLLSNAMPLIVSNAKIVKYVVSFSTYDLHSRIQSHKKIMLAQQY